MKTLLPETQRKLWETYKIDAPLATIELYYESLPHWLKRSIRGDCYKTAIGGEQWAHVDNPQSIQVNRLCYLIAHKW